MVAQGQEQVRGGEVPESERPSGEQGTDAGGDGATETPIEATGDAILIREGCFEVAAGLFEIAAAIREHTQLIAKSLEPVDGDPEPQRDMDGKPITL